MDSLIAIYSRITRVDNQDKWRLADQLTFSALREENFRLDNIKKKNADNFRHAKQATKLFFANKRILFQFHTE